MKSLLNFFSSPYQVRINSHLRTKSNNFRKPYGPGTELVRT